MGKRKTQKIKIDESIIGAEIEMCMGCGKKVKYHVYSKARGWKYCTCPACGRKFTFRDKEISEV